MNNEKSLRAILGRKISSDLEMAKNILFYFYPYNSLQAYTKF
jgi:hypothetical protein